MWQVLDTTIELGRSLCHVHHLTNQMTIFLPEGVKLLVSFAGNFLPPSQNPP